MISNSGYECGGWREKRHGEGEGREVGGRSLARRGSDNATLLVYESTDAFFFFPLVRFGFWVCMLVGCCCVLLLVGV